MRRFLTGEGKQVFETEIEGVKVSSHYKPGEEGVLSAPPTQVSVWLPCGLKVDPFPVPGIIHFEWYVPIDERTHKYMITWGSYVQSPEKRDRFYMEVENLWSNLIPNKFNNDDVWAREAMEKVYREEGGWERERLFRPDVIVTEWRKLASHYNRGIQRRDGNKA